MAKQPGHIQAKKPADCDTRAKEKLRALVIALARHAAEADYKALQQDSDQTGKGS